MIVHVAVIAVLYFETRKHRSNVIQSSDNTYQILDETQTITLPKVPWLALLIPFIPIAAWYRYSSYLTNSTYNTHFLQQINPSKSTSESG